LNSTFRRWEKFLIQKQEWEEWWKFSCDCHVYVTALSNWLSDFSNWTSWPERSGSFWLLRHLKQENRNGYIKKSKPILIIFTIELSYKYDCIRNKQISKGYVYSKAVSQVHQELNRVLQSSPPVPFILFIYAEVVKFWGRLEAKDWQIYNKEVAQLRNKTLKTF